MAFHSSWTEIKPEVAKRFWETHAIYAYDESQEVDWQLNFAKDSKLEDLDEAVKNGNLIFIENAWKHYEASVRK